MIELVNNPIQTVEPNSNVALGALKIQTGNCVSVGSESFRLNRSGFYLVNITGSIGGLTNTAVNLSVVNNTTGIAEQGGSVIIDGITAGGTQTIPFSINTIVQVQNSCTCVQNQKVLVLKNLSDAAITITNINTVVTRLA